MKNKRNILITGAYGGLATSLIELLTQQNWCIYATDINENIIKKYNNHQNITPLKLDNTNENEVKNTFQKITSEIDQLDAIVHLAGKLVVGSVVEIDKKQLQNILDINLTGVYQVNKTFLPLLVKKKSTIIIMSSETGKQTAAPFNGLYALSKHALEAYADALRRELSFLGIKVVKIRPGAFKTEMTKQITTLFTDAEQKSDLFKPQLLKGQSYLPQVYKKAHAPILIAKKIVAILNSKNPKTVYTIKADYLRSFLDVLPTKWADFLFKKGLS